jgi:hypothetical protein
MSVLVKDKNFFFHLYLLNNDYIELDRIEKKTKIRKKNLTKFLVEIKIHLHPKVITEFILASFFILCTLLISNLHFFFKFSNII